jgi:hypothetical protein
MNAIQIHSSSSPRRPVLRSVGAVLGSFVVIAVLSSAVDALMHAARVFPPYGEAMTDRMFLLATAYRALISIFGCWLAARLAFDRPMRHALSLGGLGVVVSLLGAVATWNAGPAFGPHWYPLLLVAIAMPCAWLGGRLHRQQ